MTALELAHRGARVVLACRSRERGEAAAFDLRQVRPWGDAEGGAERREESRFERREPHCLLTTKEDAGTTADPQGRTIRIKFRMRLSEERSR